MEVYIERASRKYVSWSTASDDPYEKLMLSDLEIHPGISTADYHIGLQDLCDRSRSVGEGKMECSEVCALWQGSKGIRVAV